MKQQNYSGNLLAGAHKLFLFVSSLPLIARRTGCGTAVAALVHTLAHGWVTRRSGPLPTACAAAAEEMLGVAYHAGVWLGLAFPFILPLVTHVPDGG